MKLSGFESSLLPGEVESEKLDVVQQRLQALGQTIGNDPELKVEIGQAGGQNYCDWRNKRIGINPIDLERHEDEWRGIIGHESMHHRVTRWDFIPKRIMQDLGFNGLLQSIEDIRIKRANEAMFPGAAEWETKALKGETREGGRLDHKTLVRRVTGKLGYLPKQTEFCVELRKRWALGLVDTEPSSSVKVALEATQRIIDQAVNNIPRRDSDEAEVLQKSKEVYVLTRRKIWREYQKLVELDRENEELRQLFLYLSSEEGQSDLELIKLDLEDEEKGELTKILGQVKEEIVTQEVEVPVQSYRAGFIEFDSISPGLRTKLLKAKQEIGERKQQEIEKKTEENLKGAEDLVVESLRSQLTNPAEQETHAEHEKRLLLVQMKTVSEEEARQQLEKVRQRMYEEIEKGKSAYDKAYQEVAPLVDRLVHELEKVLEPHKFPRWKKGYATGGKIGLAEAMQFEADPRQYSRLWEKKTLPQRRGYRFTLLIDLSGSMKDGNKIEETFKTTVLFAETLDRIGVPFEILGYHVLPIDEAGQKDYVFKAFDEPYTSAVRERVGDMPSEPFSNRAAHTDTGPALLWASERLKRHGGTENFLINLTDGDPWLSGSYKYKPEYQIDEVVSNIREGSDQLLIGLGIGRGIPEDTIEEHYPKGKVLPDVHQLSTEIAGLLEDMIKHPELYH